MNPFTSQKDYVNTPKRNEFDLSFTNNLTMEFGKLYPVMCKEVLPGDSFKITPSFGLRYMPMVFPVQTRMMANLHFFYVRNRNLWKDWPAFIGRTKQGLIKPFLSPTVAKNICQTGKLGDYLGVPTTLVGDYGRVIDTNWQDLTYNFVRSDTPIPAWTNFAFGDNSSFDFGSPSTDLSYIKRLTSEICQTSDEQYVQQKNFAGVIGKDFDLTSVPNPGFFHFDFSEFVDYVDTDDLYESAIFYFIDDKLVGYTNLNNSRLSSPGGSLPFSFCLEDSEEEFLIANSETYAFVFSGINQGLGRFNYRHLVLNLNFSDVDLITEFVNGSPSRSSHLGEFASHLRQTYGTSIVTPVFVCKADLAGLLSPCGRDVNIVGTHYMTNMSVNLSSVGNVDISEVSAHNPYQSGSLHVDALPFRAYESIYNAFYRNQFNDPFILNGQKEFNRFVTNNDGGADRTSYQLERRNWEMDFLTSAKQSPVDGDITPLVGVSSVGKFTFKNSDDTTYEVTPVIGDDGHTLTGIQSVQGTPENNSGLRTLTDMISIGISINDFRNVNALQRWLETNLRRGYRYKDQLMSHFGVDASFEELDMPEFLGGMSEPILVNQINQSVDQTGNPNGLGDFSQVLGSYAGQASLFASSRHSITKYFDEHGFVMAILSISPVPSYSQLMPKMFLKDNVLDYYFPEFGYIGNQPITYREVTPLQSFAAGDDINDTFGYQRAWYDYMQSVDEVHGDFRLSLDGFLINRVFNSRPELGKEFIQVDADSMTSPFSVTGPGDKILGQVYFDIEAKRPIPKYGIPRLE